MSVLQLKILIDRYGRVPFDGHVNLTGEIIYGGRIADDKDRKLIMSLLSTIYNKEAVNTNK